MITMEKKNAGKSAKRLSYKGIHGRRRSKSRNRKISNPLAPEYYTLFLKESDIVVLDRHIVRLKVPPEKTRPSGFIIRKSPKGRTNNSAGACVQ